MKKNIVSRVLLYLSLTVISILLLIPLLWAISTSLKEPSQIYTEHSPWIPNPILWTNYTEVWKVLPFATFYINSLIITIVPTIGALISSLLVAYGFARFDFPAKNILFYAVLSTMMIPSQVTIIPVFLIFKSLGWIDTFYPLIVPSFLGGGAFNIFLLRQFLMTIPRELDDAAKIDGCGSFDILRKILTPLLKPALATIAILTFMGHWNDFMGPLIYLKSLQKYPLALGLRFFQTHYGGIVGGTAHHNLLMSAAILSLIPCFILFISAQKYFVQGIVMSGLKQ
ncbi:MAG TPA: carbohydrate ABC transporter permease [bacterium]|nr:carbohydrate ABC transporter permease [bacterium]